MKQKRKMITFFILFQFALMIFSTMPTAQAGTHVWGFTVDLIHAGDSHDGLDKTGEFKVGVKAGSASLVKGEKHAIIEGNQWPGDEYITSGSSSNSAITVYFYLYENDFWTDKLLVSKSFVIGTSPADSYKIEDSDGCYALFTVTHTYVPGV